MNDDGIVVGYCKKCGQDVIYDMPTPEAREYGGYRGSYMCGCTTIDVFGKIPDYWVLKGR
jgi:hypothetical protein